MTSLRAEGALDVALIPAPAEVDGLIACMNLTKTFTGDLAGTSRGLMLSASEPGTGGADYVAREAVEARHGDVDGSFALQQPGRMSDGANPSTTSSCRVRARRDSRV